jgi:hypothetical protein
MRRCRQVRADAGSGRLPRAHLPRRVQPHDRPAALVAPAARAVRRCAAPAARRVLTCAAQRGRQPDLRRDVQPRARHERRVPRRACRPRAAAPVPRLPAPRALTRTRSGATRWSSTRWAPCSPRPRTRPRARRSCSRTSVRARARACVRARELTRARRPGRVPRRARGDPGHDAAPVRRVRRREQVELSRRGPARNAWRACAGRILCIAAHTTHPSIYITCNSMPG